MQHEISLDFIGKIPPYSCCYNYLTATTATVATAAATVAVVPLR